MLPKPFYIFSFNLFFCALLSSCNFSVDAAVKFTTKPICRLCCFAKIFSHLHQKLIISFFNWHVLLLAGFPFCHSSAECSYTIIFAGILLDFLNTGKLIRRSLCQRSPIAVIKQICLPANYSFGTVKVRSNYNAYLLIGFTTNLL